MAADLFEKGHNMADTRLIHDAAWAASLALVQIVAPCLREEEQADARAEFYEVVKAAIESYSIMKERETRRLLGGGRN